MSAAFEPARKATEQKMTFVAVTPELTRGRSLFNHVDESMPYRSARAIRDPSVLSLLRDIESQKLLLSSLENADIGIEFLQAFPRWLLGSRENRLQNLDEFRFLSFTHGTIQAFDAFYAEHRHRRFRCFRGEFMYHRAAWRRGYAHAFLDDAPVEPQDAVIISLPFSDSGSKHPLMDEVISACNRSNVPVLLDCAYMNIAGGIDFDFAQPCVEAVAFSLSKTFYGLNKMRIGVRFKKSFDDDFVDVFNAAGMVSQYACRCGLAFIETFHVDFNVATYRKWQLEACRRLNVRASDCVIFGLGDEKWSAYNRGGEHNRLCINSLIEELSGDSHG